MTLLVATVAYGGDTQLRRLAEAVSRFEHAHLVVLDNSPADRRVTSVTSFDVGGNVGYARGVNLAVAAGGDWDHLLVVNPDVEPIVDPRRLAHHFDDPSVLAVCGRLDSPRDSRAAPNVHPRVSVPRELLRSLVSSRAYTFRGATDFAHDVEQADGAWLFFTRETWNRIGGFDERFELYFEDVEIADRIRSLGGVLRYDPTVVGRHEGGSSARRSGGLAHLLLGVSRVRYYHLSGITRHPVLLGRATSVLEVLARSLTLRGEGFGTRWAALRYQWQESGAPGTVWLLGNPRPMRRRGGPDEGGAA